MGTRRKYKIGNCKCANMMETVKVRRGRRMQLLPQWAHYTLLLYIILVFYIILRFYTLYSTSIQYTLLLYIILFLYIISSKLSSSLHHTSFTTLHYIPINNANQYIIVKRFIKNKFFNSARITLACVQRVCAVCATF